MCDLSCLRQRFPDPPLLFGFPSFFSRFSLLFGSILAFFSKDLGGLPCPKSKEYRRRKKARKSKKAKKGGSGFGKNLAISNHYSIAICDLSFARYDWTRGRPDKGNVWRKFSVIPGSRPLRLSILHRRRDDFLFLRR